MTTTFKPSTFDVVQWMFDNGHVGYANEIREIESTRNEARAEAGPNAQYCEYFQQDMKKFDAEVEEVRRCAQDRYDDWASDNDY